MILHAQCELDVLTADQVELDRSVAEFRAGLDCQVVNLLNISLTEAPCGYQDRANGAASIPGIARFDGGLYYPRGHLL